MSQIAENAAQCSKFFCLISIVFVSTREGGLSHPLRVVVVFDRWLPQNCRSSITGYGHGAIPSG
jgi:hypothetical protein